VCTAASLEQYEEEVDLLLNFCLPSAASLAELRLSVAAEMPDLEFGFRKARQLAVGKTVWVKIAQSNEENQPLQGMRAAGAENTKPVFVSIVRA